MYSKGHTSSHARTHTVQLIYIQYLPQYTQKGGNNRRLIALTVKPLEYYTCFQPGNCDFNLTVQVFVTHVSENFIIIIFTSF